MSSKVHVVGHPLIQHKLSLMRDKKTPTNAFRSLLQEISLLLAYEVCRDLPMTEVEIETPLQTAKVPMLDGKKIVLASVLRAGNGMLDGMLQILPSARVGFIGLYRDAETLIPVEYYFKMPQNMDQRHAIVIDPMLATGNSAAAAVERLKAANPKSIKFACLLAAPEGIKTFHAAHPDVDIFTPAIDEKLNEKGYILPGLGDAGDRMFGT